ncbi:MAG: putative O-glycosylation ligase, exosortase A system-associated [Methyloprofundus sp.]|nr:putative O-glycosylation ligase, exosortase A system-associated [Methyloprofundus sp.]
MRDIIVAGIVMVGLGYTIRKPYYGVLLWSWLSYMNPHRLCYGFAVWAPFAQVTAIMVMVSLFISKEKKSLPKNILVYLIIIFIIWVGITTIFAFRPEFASAYFIRILKIQFSILLTLMLINTRQKLEQLLWVITFSIGFYSIKGGLFTLLTAGSYRVYGPAQSFMAENNALAIATLMVLPFMFYLRTQVAKPWQKHLMLLAAFFMGVSAIGSQSRGAFLAISIIGLYYWLQSNKKILSGLLIVIFVILLASFLPEAWYERMSTISSYDQDASAMGRVTAWILAFNVANHNIFGGGLDMWSRQTYFLYLEGYNGSHEAYVAHSIYFSILGELGWIGLALFLLIFFISWRQCSGLIKQYRSSVDNQWISDLAKMLRVGLLAYLVGGAFLSLSYFDLPWHLVASIVILKEIASSTSKKLKLDDGDNSQEESDQQEEPKKQVSSNGFLR